MWKLTFVLVILGCNLHFGICQSFQTSTSSTSKQIQGVWENRYNSRHKIEFFGKQYSEILNEKKTKFCEFQTFNFPLGYPDAKPDENGQYLWLLKLEKRHEEVEECISIEFLNDGGLRVGEETLACMREWAFIDFDRVKIKKKVKKR